MENYETIEKCLKVSERLMKSLDSTDPAEWYYKRLSNALELSERIHSILSKVLEDDEIARIEENSF